MKATATEVRNWEPIICAKPLTSTTYFMIHFVSNSYHLQHYNMHIQLPFLFHSNLPHIYYPCPHIISLSSVITSRMGLTCMVILVPALKNWTGASKHALSSSSCFKGKLFQKIVSARRKASQKGGKKGSTHNQQLKCGDGRKEGAPREQRALRKRRAAVPAKCAVQSNLDWNKFSRD